MRQTSADALAEIKGSLSGERLRAYETLYQSGPMTGSELNVALQTKNAHKRLSELVKRGVVAEVGFKNCSRTGKRALLWDVTTNLPRHVVRPAGVPAPSNEDVQHFLGRIGKRDRDLMTCEDCEGDGYTFAKKDGESGPGARPFELTWARKVLTQCHSAGVPVFIKQLGADAQDPQNGIAGAATVVPDVAKPLISQRLKDRKGGDPSEWPANLRVRQWPGGVR